MIRQIRRQSTQPSGICQRAAGIVIGVFFMVGLHGCQSPDRSVVRVASLSAPGTPWHAEWLRFQARVNAVPDSGIELDMFIAGQLGSEETVLSNLRRGRIQIGGFSLHGLASVVPELSVLLSPYLFSSRAEVDFVMDNYLTEIFVQLFAEQGIQLLRWSEVGWNHIFCREPIVEAVDIQGIKIRASSATGPQIFARRVGADNVPISYAELITGLQTGLVDCGQGGVGLYALTGIAREAPHLTLTRHIFDTGLIVANAAWLDELTAQQRGVLLGSLDPATDSRLALRAALRRITAEDLPRLGVTRYTLTDAQDQVWRDAADGSISEVIRQTGGRAAEVLALIEQGKRAFRARQPGDRAEPSTQVQ